MTFSEDGEVTIGEGLRHRVPPSMAGSQPSARASTRIIYDDVFLSGAESQARLRHKFDGLSVCGLACTATPGRAGREIARGDRVVGGAASQSTCVHEGVAYDLEVDTTSTESLESARIIAGQVS